MSFEKKFANEYFLKSEEYLLWHETNSLGTPQLGFSLITIIRAVTRQWHDPNATPPRYGITLWVGVIERERMVRSVLNGPSVLFLSQPLCSPAHRGRRPFRNTKRRKIGFFVFLALHPIHPSSTKKKLVPQQISRPIIHNFSWHGTSEKSPAMSDLLCRSVAGN